MGDPDPATVASGSLDSHFEAFNYRDTRLRGGSFWLRLQPMAGATPTGVPAVVVHKGRHFQTGLFANDSGEVTPLPLATELPGFRGVHDAVFILPAALASQPLYARVEPKGKGAEELRFTSSTLDETLGRGADHARMIALAFGALIATALAALLIWFVLQDKLFILYAILFSMQALYIAYLSGQGFEWPVLSSALPLMSHAWNVPVALSGAAAACSCERSRTCNATHRAYTPSSVGSRWRSCCSRFPTWRASSVSGTWSP